jgi:hypothetical protein
MQHGSDRKLQEIEDALRDDLVAAQVRLKGAIQRFIEVIDAISGSIPDPDESVQMCRAGAERRAALDNLVEALHRRMAFVAGHTIPVEKHPKIT